MPKKKVPVIEEIQIEEKLPEEPAEKIAPQEKPQVKKGAKRASNPSKRYQSNSKRIENKFYPVDEAIDLVKELATAKFDETVETHLSLGIDPTQTSQQVRGSVKLPHGTGRIIKILVFASGAVAEKAKEAGAILANEKIVSEIEKGSVPYNLVLSTPDEMPKIAKLAKVLGVRGLMPNPKAGTITPDPSSAIKERSGGLVDFRTSSNPTLHLGIGKASFKRDVLKENLQTFYQAVVGARPAKTSGEFIRSVTLSSTMGPSIKIDQENLKTLD